MALISAIPVIGSVVDIVNNIDTLAHMSNILGSEHHKDTKENHMFEAYALMQRVGEMMDAFVRPVVGGQRRPQQRHVHAVAFDVDTVFAVIKDCRATLPAFDHRRPFLVADFEAVRIVGPRRMRRP